MFPALQPAADITHQAPGSSYSHNQPDNVNIRCGEDFNIHVANLQDFQQEGIVERGGGLLRPDKVVSELQSFIV